MKSLLTLKTIPFFKRTIPFPQKVTLSASFKAVDKNGLFLSWDWATSKLKDETFTDAYGIKEKEEDKFGDTVERVEEAIATFSDWLVVWISIFVVDDANGDCIEAVVGVDGGDIADGIFGIDLVIDDVNFGELELNNLSGHDPKFAAWYCASCWLAGSEATSATFMMSW